jgi:hypothetical protein
MMMWIDPGAGRETRHPSGIGQIPLSPRVYFLVLFFSALL